MNNPEFTHNLIAIQKQLYHFALQLTRDPDTANDLLQDTSLLVLKKEHLFTPNTNFSGWCFTIMRHVFINQYRKENRRRKCLEFTNNSHLINHPTPLTAEKELNKNEIYQIINLLPSLQKESFLMYVDGYKYNEIADNLRVPIGTIKSRIFQCRCSLKKQLENSYK